MIKKIAIFLVFSLIGVCIGWLIKPSEDISQPQTFYVKGDVITDTILILKDTTIVIKEKIPSQKEIVYIKDTIDTDTTQVAKETIIDWNIERDYSGNIFSNDSIGDLNFKAIIQYNRLKNIITNFTPVTKHTLHSTKNKPSIFISGDISTSRHLLIGTGIKYKNIGYSIKYVKDFKGSNNGISAGILIFL